MEKKGEQFFRNAVIWSGSPIRKVEGVMAVTGGKISGIFEKGRERPEPGVAQDLGGMHIIPGLIDAHRHFSVTALMARHRDAGSWKTKQDALGAIEAACAAVSIPGQWVFFSRMDHTKWRNPSMPTLEEIDAVSRGLPVFVTDITLHRGIVSSEAIRKAGLNRGALRHPGDMDTFLNGRLKGTVWEEALGKVLFAMCRDMIGNYDDSTRREIILDEAKRCLAMGLVHVHDPGLPWDIQSLLKDVQPHTPLKISWSVATSGNLYTPPGADDDATALHSGHAPKSIKFFLDGAHRTAASIPIAAGVKAMLRAGMDSASMGSLTPLRLLFEQRIVLKNGRLTLPYQRFADADYLCDRASFFAQRGYRLVIHALGNIAAVQAATLIKRLRPAGGASIEHVLIMADEDLDSFAGCGAVASVQPGFIPLYADTLERMGAVGYSRTFALKSMIDRGIPVCISSDGPCGSDDPLFNMRRAVDRKKLDGTMLDPEEAISREEALAAASIGGSLSLGNTNGGLSTGSPATFCVVDGDPFSDSSRVVQTWIDGVRAY